MKFVHAISLSALTFALAVAPILTGCGPSQDTKSAKITAGEMPSGESWTGVYFHPVYGYLHMTEEGGNVIGKWKRADSSKCGDLSGTAQGNVLHFTWKEHTAGLVGGSAESHGKGVFVYKKPENGIPELDGQYGLNDDEVGADWHNVKQVRMTPDLKSVNCDTGTGAGSGSNWQ